MRLYFCIWASVKWSSLDDQSKSCLPNTSQHRIAELVICWLQRYRFLSYPRCPQVKVFGNIIKTSKAGVQTWNVNTRNKSKYDIFSGPYFWELLVKINWAIWSMKSKLKIHIKPIIIKNINNVWKVWNLKKFEFNKSWGPNIT